MNVKVYYDCESTILSVTDIACFQLASKHMFSM
jgi:hypothetical protein